MKRKIINSFLIQVGTNIQKKTQTWPQTIIYIQKINNSISNIKKKNKQTKYLFSNEYQIWGSVFFFIYIIFKHLIHIYESLTSNTKKYSIFSNGRVFEGLKLLKVNTVKNL